MPRKQRRNPPPRRKKSQKKIDSFLNQLIKGSTEESIDIIEDVPKRQQSQMESVVRLSQDDFDNYEPLIDELDSEDYEEDDDIISGRALIKKKSKVTGGRIKGRRLFDEEPDSEDDDISLLDGGMDRYWDDDYQDNPMGINPLVLVLATATLGGGIWYWNSNRSKK